jgi:uncharacterized protein (TIGR02147 family)
MNIYAFDDYKSFVRFMIAENKRVRGYQGQLASAAGCQPSFLSRVLASDAHLTRDQAAELCLFWGLREEQGEYFIGLVDWERAASKHLKAIIEARLAKIRTQSSKVTQLLEKPTLTEAEAQMTYYSGWHWMAVHVATSVPKLQTPQAIAERFNLPLEVVRDCLGKLEKMGLVQKKRDGRWSISKADIHLPSHSPMSAINHSNWRQRAVENAQKKIPSSLHYTSVVAVSVKDAALIQNRILGLTVETRNLVAPSPEEEVYCFTCDFFAL